MEADAVLAQSSAAFFGSLHPKKNPRERNKHQGKQGKKKATVCWFDDIKCGICLSPIATTYPRRKPVAVAA